MRTGVLATGAARTRLLNAARSILAAENIHIVAAKPERFVRVVRDSKDQTPPELFTAVLPLLDSIAALNGFIEERKPGPCRAAPRRRMHTSRRRL